MSIDAPDSTIRAEIPHHKQRERRWNDRFLQILDYDFYYGRKHVLWGLNLDIPERQVTAFIGPSGCGKSTLLRSINRLNELVENVWQRGDILLAGKSIFEDDQEVVSLRRRVGMVFQKSNPFPKSIYENTVYGLKIGGERNKSRCGTK